MKIGTMKRNLKKPLYHKILSFPEISPKIPPSKIQYRMKATFRIIRHTLYVLNLVTYYTLFDMINVAHQIPGITNPCYFPVYGLDYV